MSSVSRETQHFVGITTVNGLLRIYRSKGPYRLFWLGVTFFCSAMLLWQIGLLAEMYGQRPTVSQVSFILPDQGLTFPAVTICSYNPIKKSYVESINASGEFPRRLLDYISLAFMETQFLLTVNNPLDLERWDGEYAYYTNFTDPDFSIGQFFWNASFSCREILKICSFGGIEFNCCNYAKGVLTDIGKCYQLDLAESEELWLKRQVQAGVANGLQIIADFHAEEQMEGFGKLLHFEYVYFSLGHGLFY